MSRIGRGRYENDNREIIDDTEVIIKNPAVTADIKTNSGNVCEYWDASCHVQQGVDSIVEGVIQAGENITSWGNEVTVTVQESYVENIETPIVETVENIQEGIDETIQGGQDYIDDGVTWIQGGIDEAAQNAQDAFDATVKAAEDSAKNAQDAFDATIKAAEDAAKNAQDAFDATAKAAADAAAAAGDAAADAAAAAGDAATSGINNTLKYGALAALGIVGVLLVSKK